MYLYDFAMECELDSTIKFKYMTDTSVGKNKQTKHYNVKEIHNILNACANYLHGLHSHAHLEAKRQP